MIYTITPNESPLFSACKYALYEFRKSKGGKMRKQRIRKAKPVRYTPSTRWKIIHDWATDRLVCVS